MSSHDSLAIIDNPTVRGYVQSNITSIVEDVEATLVALETLPPGERVEILAAGESHFTRLLQDLVPDWDWEQIKSDISKRVWNAFCEVEDGQGKPDQEWFGIFAADGVGKQVIEMAVVAGFAALGTALGGAAGAVLSGAVGNFVRNLVSKFICKLLDEEIRSGLGTYCANIPQ